MAGAGKSISQQMSGIAPQVGREMGRDLSRSMSAAMNFQAAGAKIQSLGKQISSVGGTLTKYVTTPALGAATAIGGIAIAGGFRRLVGIDTAQAKLKALGHDASSVEAIMENALTAVRGTAFGLDEAATIAASAVAAGIEPGKELESYLTAVGDAAAIAGTGMDEMGAMFNKVSTSGRAYTGDLMMLGDRGIPIVEYLAEAMGKTSDEIFKMASEGKISSEMYLDAIQDNIGGAAAVMGAESFTAAWANIWAAVNRVGASFLDAGGKGGGFFSQMKPLMAEFTGLVDAAAPAAEELGVKFGEAFARVIEAVREAVTWWINLDGEMKKLILTIAGIAVAAGPVLLVIGKLITVAGSLISSFGVLIGWVGRVAAALGLAGGSGGAGALLSTLLRFAGPVGIAVSAIMLLWRHSETFRAGITSLASTVWEALKSIGAEFQRLWVGIQPVLALIPPMVEAAFGFFQTWVLPVVAAVFGFIFDIIKGVISNIVNMFSGLVDVITGVVSLVSAIFTGDWSAAWDALKQITSGAVQFVWNLIQAVLSVSILGVIRNFARTLLTSIWRPLFNSIRSIVTSVLNGVRSFIGNIVNAIRTLFSNAWNGVRGNTQSVFNGIRSFLTSIWNAIRSVITSVVNGIRAVITAVWNAIRAVISSVVNGIRSVITGGFNGIRNVVSSVMSGVRNVTTNAWNAVRNGASNAVTAMRTAISNGFRAVLNIVRNLPGQIRNVFSNVGNLLVGAGKALIGGFTDGIRNAFSGAVNAVKNGVQRIRNFLPFSPAKEGPFSGKGYTLYSGQALIEDFGKGIMGSSDEAVRAAAGVTEQVAAEMAAQVRIPDYVPASWSAPSPLAATHSVASAPAMAGVGAAERGGGDVHVAQLVVREEADIRKVAVELKKLQDRGRKAG